MRTVLLIVKRRMVTGATGHSGIDSISLNPDSVVSTLRRIAEVESSALKTSA